MAQQVPLCNECARAAQAVPDGRAPVIHPCSCCERHTDTLADRRVALGALAAYGQRCLAAIKAAMVQPAQAPAASGLVIPRLQVQQERR